MKLQLRAGHAAAENTTSNPLPDPITYEVPSRDTALRAFAPAMPVPVRDWPVVSTTPLALTRATVKLPDEVDADVASADQHVRVSASRAAVNASPPCELDVSPVHA